MSEEANENGKRERGEEEEAERPNVPSPKQLKMSPPTTADDGVPAVEEASAGADVNGGAASVPPCGGSDAVGGQEETNASVSAATTLESSSANPAEAVAAAVEAHKVTGEGGQADDQNGSRHGEAPGIILDRTGGPDSSDMAGASMTASAPSTSNASAPNEAKSVSFQQSSVTPSSNFAQESQQDGSIEERGEISIEIAGRVIGKGGEIIRDLQARSGAQIDVDQSTLPGKPRVITYRGSRSKVEFAKKLVQLISSGVADSNLPIGEAKREILIIPSSSTGKVIGRGGEMVREMQNRSHAKIDFDHSASSGVGPDQKKVVVTGTVQAVAKAKEMILFLVNNPAMEAMQSINILVDDKLRGGGQWGSGPPYPNLPNQGMNMRPDMLDQGAGGGGYGGFGGSAPFQGGYPQGGGSYGPQPTPQGFGGPGGGSAMNRFLGGGGGTMVAGPGAFSDLMYAKKQFMGRIIGAKGITINDLQRRSGTDIQINQDVAPGQDCEIRVKGNREGVDMAKQMINQIIEIGPNHPFAGGQSGGGGGGGGSYGGGGGGGYGQQNFGGYGQQQYDYQQQYGQAPYDQQQNYQEVQGFGGQQQVQQQQPGGYNSQQYGAQHHQQQPPVHQQQSYNSMQNYAGLPAVNSGSGPPPSYGGQPMAPQHQQQQQQPYGGYPQQQQPPPPAAAPAAIDSGWKSTTTPDGQTYYWNERTGATQWEKPPGMP